MREAGVRNRFFDNLLKIKWDSGSFRGETIMTHHWHFSDHLKSVWKLMKDLGFSNDASEPIDFSFELTGTERPVDLDMQ